MRHPFISPLNTKKRVGAEAPTRFVREGCHHNSSSLLGVKPILLIDQEPSGRRGQQERQEPPEHREHQGQPERQERPHQAYRA